MEPNISEGKEMEWRSEVIVVTTGKFIGRMYNVLAKDFENPISFKVYDVGMDQTLWFEESEVNLFQVESEMVRIDINDRRRAYYALKDLNKKLWR